MGKMILVTQSVFQKGLSTPMTFYFPRGLAGEAASFSSNSFPEYISLYLLIGMTLNAVFSHRKMGNRPICRSFPACPIILYLKKKAHLAPKGF